VLVDVHVIVPSLVLVHVAAMRMQTCSWNPFFFVGWM
jgi:hypothetical protein